MLYRLEHRWLGLYDWLIDVDWINTSEIRSCVFWILSLFPSLPLSIPAPPVALALCLSKALEKESPMGTSAREREDPGIHQWRIKAESTLFSSLLSRLHYFSIRIFFQKTIAWSNLNPNHISTTTSTAKQKKGWVRRGGKGPRHHHVRYQISDLYQRLPPQRKKQVLGRKSTRSSMGYI